MEDRKRWREVASLLGGQGEPLEEEIVTNKAPLIQRAQDTVKDILKNIGKSTNEPDTIEISEPKDQAGAKVEKKRFAVKRKDMT